MYGRAQSNSTLIVWAKYAPITVEGTVWHGNFFMVTTLSCENWYVSFPPAVSATVIVKRRCDDPLPGYATSRRLRLTLSMP